MTNETDPALVATDTPTDPIVDDEWMIGTADTISNGVAMPSNKRRLITLIPITESDGAVIDSDGRLMCPRSLEIASDGAVIASVVCLNVTNIFVTASNGAVIDSDVDLASASLLVIESEIETDSVVLRRHTIRRLTESDGAVMLSVMDICGTKLSRSRSNEPIN